METERSKNNKKDWNPEEWQGRSRENVEYSIKAMDWSIKVFVLTVILYWISRFFN